MTSPEAFPLRVWKLNLCRQQMHAQAVEEGKHLFSVQGDVVALKQQAMFKSYKCC